MVIYCAVTQEYCTFSYSGIVDSERYYFDSEQKAIKFINSYNCEPEIKPYLETIEVE